MPVLPTGVDQGSASFRQNRADMLAMIEHFRGLEQKVRDHSERGRQRFHGRGQLLGRERLALLLDRGAPFLEFSTLAGNGMHDDDGDAGIQGGGIITGIGWVSGTRVVITCNDPSIKGGSIAPMGLKKHLRAQQVAMENKLPLVNLVESAGANLLYQAEIFVDGGRTFCNLARLSAAGIPIVTVVHGSSTAGGAYMPGMSDYVVTVRGRAKIFLGGPPLVKAAIGEDSDDESLGGAEMHSTITGTSEHLAEDDADAIRIARDIVAKLGWNELQPPEAARDFQEPLHDIDEICGIVPVDYRKPYEVREVIARLVDGSDFLDFKPLFGANTVCGHAAIEGYGCGIIGNNGPIFPDDAVKAAHFIQLCSQSNTPLIFLQNTTGYMVGRHAEEDGMVKHGSKMIQAVSNAHVPKLTLMIGASFGAGNYGMCGRGYEPRFILGWPNNRIAVMGGEQAGGVMLTITREKFARQGIKADEAALEQMFQAIVDRTEIESQATYASARIWDDGLIDPRDSRRVLAIALSICRETAMRQLYPNGFAVARG